MAMVKLFEMKRISSGMAAKLVDIPRVIFLLSLQRFNMPMIDLDEDELIMDIQNAWNQKNCSSLSIIRIYRILRIFRIKK